MDDSNSNVVLEKQVEENQKESTFYDTVITFFMNNPELWDKMEDEYSITVKKLEKLTCLSSFLKQMHIMKEVPDIIRAWENLVKKFKQQLALENSAKSGSEAIINNFPYYKKSLAFIKPAIQNRATLSTINFSSLNPVDHVSALVSPRTHMSMNAIPGSSSTYNLSTPDILPGSSYDQNTAPAYSQSNPSTSEVYKRSVPEYDNFAKKKLKSIKESEFGIKEIGKKLLETLDTINKKATNSNETNLTDKSTSQPTAIDYRQLLSSAVEKIPVGYENECLNFIVEELEKFDEEQAQNNNDNI